MTWTGLTNYDQDLGQPGILAGRGLGFANLTLVANRGYYTRFETSRALVVTKMAFVLTTAAGADDAIDLGIYDNAGAKIVTLGATTGQLNTGAGTIKTPAISASLAPGVYYAAMSVGTLGGSAGVVQGVNLISSLNSQFFGAAIPQIEAFTVSSSHPLPNNIGTPVAGNSTLLAVRES